MKRVLLIVDTSRLTGRELLVGAEKYISTCTRWEVHTLPPNYLAGGLSNKFPDGHLDDFDGLFICYAQNITPLLKIPKPKVVHHTPREILPQTSLIVTHSIKIGQMAAEYFLSLGFKNYAFCGFKELFWSEQRQTSFSQTLRKKGIAKVDYFADVPSERHRFNPRKLAKWVCQLPKPVCIFACNDDRALYILEACKSLAINVPEEVAILGVDNDTLICNLSHPPFSSIALDFQDIGFRAARHLDQLMNRQAADAVLQVEPVDIITRRSTDVLAFEDQELATALRFLRSNYQLPIQVSDVVKATVLSRRELEYRFKSQVKKTIKEEIDRLRIDYIKKKLLHSREPIYKIAETLTFTDPEHLSRYFKNLTGTSPSMYRQGAHSQLDS